MLRKVFSLQIYVKSATFTILKQIHHHKVDGTDRHCKQGTIESVQKSSVPRYYIARIFNIVISFPLRLEQIPVDTCDIHYNGKNDAVHKWEYKQACKVQYYGGQYCGEHSPPESYPRFFRRNGWE